MLEHSSLTQLRTREDGCRDPGVEQIYNMCRLTGINIYRIVPEVGLGLIKYD